MTEQSNDDLMEVPAHVFDAVLITACRASVLLSRASAKKSAGPDDASELESAAQEAASRIRALLLSAQGPDAKNLVKSMGWTAPGALVAFLYDGTSAGEG